MESEEDHELSFVLGEPATPERLKCRHFLSRVIRVIALGGIVGSGALIAILRGGPEVIALARTILGIHI